MHIYYKYYSVILVLVRKLIILIGGFSILFNILKQNSFGKAGHTN